MKRNLLLMAALLMISVYSNAQYWTAQNLNLPATSRGVRDISVVDANNVWVICYDGTTAGTNVLDFSHTNDGGTTWTAGLVGSDTTYSFSNICGLSYGEAWACMYDQLSTTGGGGLWHTVDSGAIWDRVGLGSIFDANSFPDFVHFKDPNHGFAFGDPNNGYFEIYTTTNGGVNWTRTPQANTPTPLANEFGIINDFAVSGDTIWAGTDMGRVLRSVDYGLTWTAATVAATSRTVIDVAFSDHNNGLAMLVSGTTTFTYYLYKTTNGGTTWSQVAPVSGFWFKQNITNVPGTSYFVSTSQDFTTHLTEGSSYTTNLGNTWTLLDTAVQRGEVRFWNSSTGWCGGFSGQVISTDGGIFKWGVGPVGLNSPSMVKAELSAYPNPSNGIVTLNFKNRGAADVSLSLTNSLGEQVFTKTIKNTVLVNKTFDFSGLPKGIYILNLEYGTERSTEKLVIQ